MVDTKYRSWAVESADVCVVNLGAFLGREKRQPRLPGQACTSRPQTTMPGPPGLLLCATCWTSKGPVSASPLSRASRVSLHATASNGMSVKNGHRRENHRDLLLVPFVKYFQALNRKFSSNPCNSPHFQGRSGLHRVNQLNQTGPRKA